MNRFTKIKKLIGAIIDDALDSEVFCGFTLALIVIWCATAFINILDYAVHDDAYVYPTTWLLLAMIVIGCGWSVGVYIKRKWKEIE